MGPKQGPRAAKFDHLLKLLLIGDSGVGKSCILLRYSDDSFTSSFITTIGIDFKIKQINVASSKVKLQIWDTAGQERFRTITTAYYRGAMGILLVYDVTDEVSFENVQNWMRQIRQNATENVTIFLIANKCDVSPSERKVSTEQGKAEADKYNVKFFETSAKLNTNISEAFSSIATDIVENIKENPERYGGGGEASTGRKSKATGGATALGAKPGKKEGCC